MQICLPMNIFKAADSIIESADSCVLLTEKIEVGSFNNQISLFFLKMLIVSRQIQPNIIWINEQIAFKPLHHHPQPKVLKSSDAAFSFRLCNQNVDLTHASAELSIFRRAPRQVPQEFFKSVDLWGVCVCLMHLVRPSWGHMLGGWFGWLFLRSTSTIYRPFRPYNQTPQIQTPQLFLPTKKIGSSLVGESCTKKTNFCTGGRNLH